ncbi:MAG: PAS domain-containing protein, partial [Casimicrobiaceae bacterium]
MTSLHDASESLLNALPAHIAVLDAEGIIISVNEAWRKFADQNGLGDANHGVGRNYLDACEPAPGPGALQTWALATGLRAVLHGERSSFTIEYRCDSPSERRWFMLMATPVDPARRAGAVLMHVDVSARALAEEETRRSNELLQAVADGTPDIVYVKDTRGRYKLCNRALASFTGRALDQILGCDDRVLYGGVEAELLIEDDRAMFANAKVQETEKWLTGVDGRRLFHSTRVPHRDGQGLLIGIIGIARDVTDDRIAQQELHDSKAMLDVAGRVA